MNYSMIITEIGKVTAKGNQSLKMSYKKGLIKQTLYLLTSPEQASEVKLGDDVASQIPSDFKIRESIGDNGAVLKWVEAI